MSGYNAYQKVARQTENSRSVEFRLLGQVTAALIAASKKPIEAPKLVDALLWNKRVWDHFMIDLADVDNQLPKELRQSLIGIGVWVNREVKRCMSAMGECEALIEINQIVMKGLRGEDDAAARGGQQPPSTPPAGGSRPLSA